MAINPVIAPAIARYSTQTPAARPLSSNNG